MTASRINVTLSAYEGDSFPGADEKFEAYVLAELHRQHPTAAIEISTAQGRTRVFVDGEPNQDLAQEIGADWWEQFCAEAESLTHTIQIDEECGADEIWDALHAYAEQHPAPACLAPYVAPGWVDSVNVTDADARAAREWFRLAGAELNWADHTTPVLVIERS